MHPQVGCRPLEVRISFEVGGIAIANNPFWRPIVEKPRAERLEILRSKEFRDSLREMSSGGRWVANLGPSWQQIFLRLSSRCEHSSYLDESIAGIAALRAE